MQVVKVIESNYLVGVVGVVGGVVQYRRHCST